MKCKEEKALLNNVYLHLSASSCPLSSHSLLAKKRNWVHLPTKISRPHCRLWGELKSWSISESWVMGQAVLKVCANQMVP